MAFTTSKRSRAIPVPLCPYQLRWVMDKSRFKIAVKARRVGFTFATTLEIALDVISRRTRWLVISRTQDTAREALREIGSHLAAMQIALTGISERPTGLFFDGMRVHQLVITLPNGSEVIAMTAHPDAARGFGGNVFLDEHGFHRDSEELWKGAEASIMRGHRLIVVSTPHYQTGKYYDIVRECGLALGHAPDPNDGYKGIWSRHWVDIWAAAPQLHGISAPGFEDVKKAVAELRALAGDEENWNQEFCCQFLSAAEMWIPLELIAAARYPEANLEWDPERVEGPIYIGADIGRKRDRTQIWIDERLADVAVCRGVITLDRTPFEQQFNVLGELISHPKIRRACIDQTGIGLGLVERLQEKFGSKVEGVTFTSEAKEQMAILLRRRMEEKLDKIPANAPRVEADFAMVKRQVTASGNLRFDAVRTENSHADIFWAKALADFAADSGVAAACAGVDEPEYQRFSLGGFSGAREERRPSIWDADRVLAKQG